MVVSETSESYCWNCYKDYGDAFQRLLAKLFDMTKRQSGLLQDALVLLHTDIAMVREGFDQMTNWELEKVIYSDTRKLFCSNKKVQHRGHTIEYGSREADQPLCFRFIDSTIPLLSKYKISSLQPSSVVVQPGLYRTLLETPRRFSHNEAQIISSL